jgi:CHASE3 domain sensor protein
MTVDTAMSDDRIIQLLEEIRDLQRQHVDRYGEALHNQQESIGLQQAALRRVRIILGFATIVLIMAVGMLVLLLLRVAARLT